MKNINFNLLVAVLTIISILSCRDSSKGKVQELIKSNIENPKKIKIILDTDANNELDDQFAIAYMLFSGGVFDVKGITVNATSNEPDIESHYLEAERIMQLCNLKGAVPLLNGAEGDFREISSEFKTFDFDGQDAVDFILEKTKKEPIVIVAVGKLTNIALALKKDPYFAKRTRIVWLGSNYPESGEYNQDNDTIAMNYVLNSTIPFEMVTVRYGKTSGSDAVKVSKTEVREKMANLGPKATKPIIGRHGGTFNRFGDYATNLFEHIFDHIGTSEVTPSRPLFDMVALSVLKNPNWGESTSIPCPIFINGQWMERPENKRKIILWENFERDSIISDFYNTMNSPNPISN